MTYDQVYVIEMHTRVRLIKVNGIFIKQVHSHIQASLQRISLGKYYTPTTSTTTLNVNHVNITPEHGDDQYMKKAHFEMLGDLSGA